MGCCNSKKSTKTTTSSSEKKQYSWDKREAIDPSKYIIDGKSDTLIVRNPGTINGQQFVIQNCNNASIFLLDHMATVTVDDCIGCQIILGPIETSVFFRDCRDCKCIVSCQQFRTRDCSKMDVFLSCSTQPIIESSARMRFGCYQLFYDDLKQQFKNASLSLFNNNWSNIHDFTPVPEDKNWIPIPESENISKLMNLALGYQGSAGDDVSPPLQLSVDGSVVPLTGGIRQKNSEESSFVIVFHHDEATETALNVIEKLKTRLDLVQTKEIMLSTDDVSRVFGSEASKIATSSAKGPVIGLEFNGDDAVKLCGEVVNELGSHEHHLYSSPSPAAALQEVEHFYNFCDMQLSA